MKRLQMENSLGIWKIWYSLISLYFIYSYLDFLINSENCNCFRDVNAFAKYVFTIFLLWESSIYICTIQKKGYKIIKIFVWFLSKTRLEYDSVISFYIILYTLYLNRDTYILGTNIIYKHIFLDLSFIIYTY